MSPRPSREASDDFPVAHDGSNLPIGLSRRYGRHLGDLLLFTAVSLWALNYSIVKFGLSEIAPLAFPIFRFGVGGIALLVILRLREGSIGVRREDLPLLTLVGFFGITLNQISFVFALTNTSASDTALLGATGPIVTALLAAAVGLEP